MKLRLLAKGTALFGDREVADGHGQVRRYIGRKHDPKGGVQGLDEKKQVIFSGAWPVVAEPTVKDTSLIDPLHAHDYRKAVRDGDLWAADEETAAACGVKWDAAYQAALAEDRPDVAKDHDLAKPEEH